MPRKKKKNQQALKKNQVDWTRQTNLARPVLLKKTCRP
jgi:hypothetical protein